MSGAGSQLAPQPAREVPPGRSLLAHLLHALNQPLTGLQCSLELAVAGPRPREEYVRTLREGLELTTRMRILVEAIRELADTQQARPEKTEPLLLDELLRAMIDDLLPIAEAKSVRLSLASYVPLPVRGERNHLETLIFRLLESALSLTQDGKDLQIEATAERDDACIAVGWHPGAPPEHSPFSRPELGLLLAQAGWEQVRARVTTKRTETTHHCAVRLPLGSPAPHDVGADLED
jgi:two-component system OmpR family sensor kinase